MRRGIGHYTHKGLGGAATASRRMGGTSRTATHLLQSLTSLASGTTAAGGQLDPGVLQGRSASEVTTAIVEAIRPVDGTQDTEASRNAIQDALSQLLDAFPNADLLNLSADQRWLVAESYLATDIFNRIQLDVGRAIQDKAPTDDRTWHIAARCSRGCAEPDVLTTAERKEAPCAPNDEAGPCQ